MSLLDLAEAQARLLALAPAMPEETVATEDASGRVLARDLLARRSNPAADLSAMDGYAIAGAGPWRLMGESRAGVPFAGQLEPCQCTRISTGAHLPDGADAVLIQEDARLEGATVHATTDAPTPGHHVRRAGFDFAKGEVLIERGTRLSPAGIALALAGGHGRIAVARRPRIVVLDCGDELVGDPASAGEGQTPATNGAMLAAMLRELAGPCTRIGPVPDDHAALAEALEEAAAADILITSGGASVGKHDLVRQALIESGAEIAFWKVAIRPGKPLMVATRPRDRTKCGSSARGRSADGADPHGAGARGLDAPIPDAPSPDAQSHDAQGSGAPGSQIVLGLPGNPVSSFVTAFLFALPLVRAAMGMRAALPVSIRLPCAQAFPANGARRAFLRGVIDDGRVSPAPSQDSSALASLARADCLVERAPGAGIARIGEEVDVYCLHNGANARGAGSPGA